MTFNKWGGHKKKSPGLEYVNIVNPKDQEDAKALQHHVLPQTKNFEVKAAVNVPVGGGADAKAEGAAAVAAADFPARGWCRHVSSQVCQYDKVCTQPDNPNMKKKPSR